MQLPYQQPTLSPSYEDCSTAVDVVLCENIVVSSTRLEDALYQNTSAIYEPAYYASGLLFAAVVWYIVYRVIMWVFSIVKSWALTW